MFRQHTIPPSGTFTVDGLKKLSPIVTSVEPTGQCGGGPSTLKLSTQAPTLPLEPSIWIVYVVPAVTEKMTWLPSEQESSFEATTVRGQDEPVKIVK